MSSINKRLWQLLLCIVCTIGIIPGCGPDPDCERMVPRYFDIFGIDVQHVSGNTFSSEILPDGSSIIFDNYLGIQILPNVNLYGKLDSNEPLNFECAFSPGSLWAGNFIAGEGGSETEMLTDISVTTVNDYDDNHPEGSNINDLLMVNVNDNLIPLRDYINQKETELVQITDLPLLISTQLPPSQGSDFQVTIDFSLSTGENYQRTSGIVSFIE